MFEQWSFLKKPHPVDDVDVSPLVIKAESPAMAERLVGGGPLDLVGQQSESIRDRVNSLAERLDDLQSLSGEFSQITGPLNTFVEQHAATRAKLMEVEALLERERDVSLSSRSELRSLQLSSAKLAGDFQEVDAALRDREEMLRHQDTRITELRLRISELKSHSEALDNRLFSETERTKTLGEENATLRHDVAIAEEMRAQAEQQSAEAREIIGLSEAECARLQHLTESLTQKVASYSRAISEMDPQLQSARASIANLQAKLASEQATRQKLESAREAERSAQEAEVASLSMKNDGLTAHVVNTDKLLAHVRDQLRDKSEAFRLAEKTLKDAIGEKATLERRLDVALDATARTNAQSHDLQKMNAELKDRCDMLAKAVAAKDQILESANRKSSSLLERIEQLNARFEQERSEFEVTHRRLIEELQNERAERSLAHGALDIARKSRSTVLAQYTALKRQTGTTGSRAVGEDEDIGSKPDKPVASNVMAFNPPE